jgi:hypothetical protein
MQMHLRRGCGYRDRDGGIEAARAGVPETQTRTELGFFPSGSLLSSDSRTLIGTQVGEVTELAGGVVQVLKQAQERVLEERRCDAEKRTPNCFGCDASWQLLIKKNPTIICHKKSGWKERKQGKLKEGCLSVCVCVFFRLQEAT